MHWGDLNDIVDRLRLLITSRPNCNGNHNHNNEIATIIEELEKADVI